MQRWACSVSRFWTITRGAVLCDHRWHVGIGRTLRPQVAEEALGQLDDLLVPHVASGGDDQAFRSVVAEPEIDHRRPVGVGDRFFRTGNLAPDRIVTPDHLVDQVVHQVFRNVLHGADLLEDDLSFLVQLGCIEG
jgi:hypothetical protein